MIHKIFLTLAISGLSFAACAQQKNVSAHEPLTAKQMMAYLTDDDKLGRKTGSEPMLKIQQWLTDQYIAIGLQPLPGHESFLQSFEATDEKLAAANLLGYLPCRCDNDRYFVIGAHYDHIGVKSQLEGDQVFNGADDDASGVVASLLIARELAKAPKLPFNIIIATWDAEELGLLGSTYFVENPLVDLDKIESGFMFELVGSKSEKNTAWMTGFDYSSLFPLMKAQMAKYDWQLGEDPFAEQMLFMRSDNAPFALMDMNKEKASQVFREGKKVDITGIPVHAISVWQGQQHYHQAHDDMSVIDFENLTSLSMAIANAIKELPADTKVEWKENSQFNFQRP